MIRRESAVMTLCKSVIDNESEHSPSCDFSCEREMRQKKHVDLVARGEIGEQIG